MCVHVRVCACVSRRNDLCLFPSLQSFSVGANCSTAQSVSAGLSPSLPKLATNCFLFLLLLVSCSLIGICWPSNKTCPECCLLKRKHRNLQKCNCPPVLNWVSRKRIMIRCVDGKIRQLNAFVCDQQV